MNKVTDPNILAQLNSGEESQPVTDPALLAQLNGESQKAPMQTGSREAYMKERGQAREEGVAGALQGFGNQGIKIANLFKDNPYAMMDFAPKTQAAKYGETAGEVGSFFAPGGLLGGGIKAASYVPKLADIMNYTRKGIDSVPYLRGLLKVGRGGAEAGVFNAANNPDNALSEGAKGFGLGAGVQGAANLLGTQNPLVRAVGSMGIGAAAGLPFDHPGYGAMAGLMAPSLARQLGGGKNAIAEDVLEGLTPKDVMRAKKANDRLGTSVTPAQASGNYVTSGNEGRLKTSVAGATQGERLENRQIREQSKSINKMLDKIYIPSTYNETKINALYGEANKVSVKPEVISKIRKNPILESAFTSVKNNPAFSDIPENNYKFLAEVDRQLYRDQKSAMRSSPSSAYAIGQVKKPFNTFLKENNSNYLEATKAAQPRIVRENMEAKLNKNKEDYTGKNFYSGFLNTRKAYSDVLRDTKNFPEAQQDIKDMRKGWKHLSNVKTVGQSEAQAKTGISEGRDHIKVILNAIKNMAGSKGDVNRLNTIYSKDWDKGFDRIMKIQDQRQRNKELLAMFGKIGVAYGLSD